MGNNIFSQMPETSVDMQKFEDGSFVLQPTTKLENYDRCVGEWLEKWAIERPEAVFIAEKVGESWSTLTYQQFRDQVHHIAQGLIDRGLATGQPIVILSGNSNKHALLKMAALHIGLPVTSVSVAYSLVAQTHERLRSMIERLSPAAVFAEDGALFKGAIEGSGYTGPVIIADHLEEVGNAIGFSELLDNEVTEQVFERFMQVSSDTHAKYMFTSGSTGLPKIVVVTQRMMCSNQQMIAQYYGFLGETVPRVLDWLPWSHTFGTNHNFNLVLRNGGSLYIDNGKPLPGQIEKTITNIKEVKPNLYFNVPKGYEALVEHCRHDQQLKEVFFSNLKMLFYAAASLSKPVWDELKQMADDVEAEVFFTTEWGATETAPAITNVHWYIDKPGNIGIPFPGVQLKFTPNGSKMELRVKGPMVFTEYLNDPEKTAESFDEDGFYFTGDAGLLADPTDPAKGIIFDGRVAEDFKLSTGTWVSVSSLRARVQQYFGELFSDVVVTGQDRDYIGIMGFPGCRMRELADDKTSKMSFSQLAQNSNVRAALINALTEMSKSAGGSSQRVRRLLVLETPPKLDLGEVTDKGSLNQRKLLETRKSSVESLYSEQPSESVISL